MLFVVCKHCAAAAVLESDRIVLCRCKKCGGKEYLDCGPNQETHYRVFGTVLTLIEVDDLSLFTTFDELHNLPKNDKNLETRMLGLEHSRVTVYRDILAMHTILPKKEAEKEEDIVKAYPPTVV